jgi:hypothetical protein
MIRSAEYLDYAYALVAHFLQTLLVLLLQVGLNHVPRRDVPVHSGSPRFFFWLLFHH